MNTDFISPDTASTVVSGSSTVTCSTTRDRLNSAVGTYPIDCDVSGLSATNYSFAVTKGTFTVTREDATITYTGDSLKSTGSTASNSTTTLTLATAVTEMADGSLGNKLDQEQVKFTLLNGNLAVVSTCTTPVTLVPSATAGTATASCTTSALGADNYTVNMQLVDKTTGVGYYVAPDETAAATVVVAGTGFTTGGGWLLDPGTNAKSNFGFTVKYLKNSGIQGNSLFRKCQFRVGVESLYWAVLSSATT